MVATQSIIHEMLLIDDPSILAIKNGMAKISGWFVFPAFIFSLLLEYFGEMKFYEVVKKLILVLVFMTFFYAIHKEGVELSLSGSVELLKEVSPRNLFIKKWTQVKMRTKEDVKKDNSFLKSVENFIVPNFNDYVATIFFVLSKLCLLVVRLVYSTVYHLTYIFAPITALLFFFPVTRGALSGTIISSLWCMLMPFVLVAIFAIIGNSFTSFANNGESIISSLDQVLWFFGLCFLIALSPVFTMGLLKGAGVSMSGTASTMLMLNSGTKILSALPMFGNKGIRFAQYGFRKFLGNKEKSEGINKSNYQDDSYSKNSNWNNGIQGNVENQKSQISSFGRNNRLTNPKLYESNLGAISRNRPFFQTENNSNKPMTTQSPETYMYDKKFWDQITPDHRDGIKVKYGITSERPTPNKLYYPIPEHERKNISDMIRNPQRNNHVTSDRQAGVNVPSQKFKRPINKPKRGELNEARSI